MRAPSTTSAPSSAWCRCSAASRCRSASSRSPALSGWLASFLGRPTVFLLGLIVPAISVVGVLLIRAETGRAAPARLAHPRRRHRVRRRGGRARRSGRAVRAGDDLRAVDGGDLHHAGPRDARARSRDAPRDPASPASSSSRSARRPRSATAISGGRSMCSSSTRRSTARCARPARSSPSWRCGCFSKQLTEYSVTKVLFWLAVAGTILSLPNIGLFYGAAPLDRSDVRLRRAHHRGRSTPRPPRRSRSSA